MSEIEEVTHVIRLAVVCLDASPSDVKADSPPSSLSKETEASNSFDLTAYMLTLHIV